MSRVSRRRRSGRSKRTPCIPSTTCGPLTPSPRTNRPPVMRSRLSAVIAIIDGTRVVIWMMPVPRRMREVTAASQATAVTASWPHASADHAKSTPRRSASRTYSTTSGQSSPLPPAPPNEIDVLMPAYPYESSTRKANPATVGRKPGGDQGALASGSGAGGQPPCRSARQGAGRQSVRGSCEPAMNASSSRSERFAQKRDQRLVDRGRRFRERNACSSRAVLHSLTAACTPPPRPPRARPRAGRSPPPSGRAGHGGSTRRRRR